MFLADQALYGMVTIQPKPLLRRILDRFPKSQILVAETDSVVNLFGYALWKDGALIRAYGGSGDKGVTIETGTIQPEEKESFDNSLVKNGQRYFKRSHQFQSQNPVVGFFLGAMFGREMSADVYGEELVFEMTRRFLGERLNTFGFEVRKPEGQPPLKPLSKMSEEEQRQEMQRRATALVRKPQPKVELFEKL